MSSKKKRKKKPHQKKAQQRRKKQSPASSYDKLLRRVKQRGEHPDTQYIIEPPGEIKMSEVILDFVEPFLNEAPDHQAKQSIISVAIIAWNISLLPFFGRMAAFKKIKMDMNMDRQGVRVIKMFTGMMRRYRKRNHPGLKRYILDYELTETRDDLNLNIVSTMNPPKA